MILYNFCILSSIEISRRGYEFNHQYILKDKEQKKNIVFGNFDEDKVVYAQSLEELSISEQFSSFKELYDSLYSFIYFLYLIVFKCKI